MPCHIVKRHIIECYECLPGWGKAVAVGAVALVVYIPFRYWLNRPRSTPIKKDFKEGMVYLYQFPRFKNIPSISPFCLKLETWLRMADIPYENITCCFKTRSLEGTLPFVEYNGVEHPDSALAIRFVVSDDLSDSSHN
ncbi:hypothetical protein AB6A40_010014 [Gnathostoma spinigerum]|uniref:Thioredoxin-like fold domain-containing protein n=1 Tax=Gnathostoma spinigerum TaxID=75299 RepID=A0ABD6EUW8_9BILA